MIIRTKRKEIRLAYDVYRATETKTLSDFYANPSQAKRRAYKEILELCAYMGGYKPSVISANSQVFTMGFITIEPHREFHYFTRANHYIMKLD